VPRTEIMRSFASKDITALQQEATKRLWDEDAELPCTNGSNASPQLEKKAASPSIAKSLKIRHPAGASGAVFPSMPEKEKPARQMPDWFAESSRAVHAGKRAVGSPRPARPISPSTTPVILPGEFVGFPAARCDLMPEPVSPRSTLAKASPNKAVQGASSAVASAPKASRLNEASLHARHILIRSQRMVDKDSPLNRLSPRPSPRPPKPPG
jgi:hypothetical protein